MSEGGLTSKVLLGVKVEVVSTEVCSSTMDSPITEGMLCAGGKLGEDACQVMSGHQI